MTAEVREDRTPAQRDFAEMLRQLRGLAKDVPLAEIALHAAVHQTTLSKYLSAAFLPDPRILPKLYDVAQDAASLSGVTEMPFSREALDAAYVRAQAKICRNCPVRSKKGDGDVSSLRTSTEAVLDADADAAMAHADVPVPLPEGDRQPRSELEWATATEIARYLSEGRAEDARVILHHAGATSLINDLPSIIDSCRAVGLNIAADTVLHYAGLRTGPEVLSVVRLLVSSERYVDAKAVLQSAAPC